MNREFLGWDRPAIELAVEYFFQRLATAAMWDLSHVLVAVPGARASRLLLRRLAEAAEAKSVPVLLPQTVTVGRLPESLYEQKRPMASPLVQKLAWAEALRQTSYDVLRDFVPEPPRGESDPRWRELGTLLWTQHRELTANALDFRIVAQRGKTVAGFNETRRWHAMAEVQATYLRLLDQLDLWDPQTARLYAIEHELCCSRQAIYLLAAVDLNISLRRMLDQLDDSATALIYAPEDIANAFDPHGCLLPEAWQQMQIHLDDQNLIFVESPSDQAAAVLHSVDELSSAYSVDQITVGVPDEKLVPLIEHQLQQAGIASRWGPGNSVESSRPFRLIRCLIDYLQSDSFRSFCELVRHPDIERWLVRRPDFDQEEGRTTGLVVREDYLESLDRYASDHFPGSIRDDWIQSSRQASDVRTVLERLESLVAPLRGTRRMPAEWIEPVMDFLMEVYGSYRLDPNRELDVHLLEACQHIRDCLDQLLELPRSMASATSVATALLMMLDNAQTLRLPAATNDGQIELLGWLELTLDDRPALVVSSVNEGIVPTSVNSDLLLPDAMRRKLGIDDNQRRYARDAYALAALNAGRQSLRIIFGARTQEGDPIAPSRLLFATDTDTIVRRSLRFFSPEPQFAEVRNPPTPSQWSLEMPRPKPLTEQQREKLQTLNATDFRRYIACPYRFYLSRVLKLERLEDGLQELDPPRFGNVVHEVLEEFGCGEKKDSEDAGEIFAELNRLLQLHLQTNISSSCSATLHIQFAQLKHRLEAFAARQAAWRREGWEIRLTERETGTLVTDQDLDGVRFRLRGRIDRIDYHAGSNTYAILDYKSSETAKKPEAFHHPDCRSGTVSTDDWQDLQLPLYRHLLVALRQDYDVDLSAPCLFGYVTLPKQPDKTDFLLAQWSAESLRTADDAARRVVQAIQAERFWPPAADPNFSDPALAEICQDGVLRRSLSSDPTRKEHETSG